jgi:hypothetical protein
MLVEVLPYRLLLQVKSLEVLLNLKILLMVLEEVKVHPRVVDLVVVADLVEEVAVVVPQQIKLLIDLKNLIVLRNIKK